VQLLFELCGLLELVTFVDEIPARNTAETSVSNVAAAAADAVRSSTPDTTTMSRASQAAVADAVRELRSPGRRRPRHRPHSTLTPPIG
jgi:hypothetical protein